ncbi:hypothetical protein ACFQU7_42090 [Pseudoroseomonas wenyumeiae]
MPSPEFLVVSPAPVEAPAADWIAGPQPGTAAVYRDPALLWRGARALFGRGVLTTPGDMRPLIEEAADANVPGAIPPTLAAAAGRAYGIALGHTEIARQNTLEVGKGYAAGQGAWDRISARPPGWKNDRVSRCGWRCCRMAWWCPMPKMPILHEPGRYPRSACCAIASAPAPTSRSGGCGRGSAKPLGAVGEGGGGSSAGGADTGGRWVWCCRSTRDR